MIEHQKSDYNTCTFTCEPRHEKTCLRGFATQYDSNRPAQVREASSSLEILGVASIGIILSNQRTRKTLIRLSR